MKNYLKKFFHKEDGAELVEWSIVIAIVAILAAAVFAVVTIVYKQITNAGDTIGNLDYDSISGGGSDGGSATPSGGGAD